MRKKPTSKPSRDKPVSKHVSRRRGDVWTGNEIRRANQLDPDAVPEVDAAWFKSARVVMPKPKQAVSLRLDREVMDWFKLQGKGYQTRINAVLRAYVTAHR